jgi:hypothetical protein
MKKLLAVLLLLVVYSAYGQDYTVAPVTPPPLQNIYEKGGTNLALQDDGIATNISIGFDFEFYGNIFDKVNISNNGFLTFGGTNSMCCDGMQLPAWGMDNSIIGLWTDLISTNNINPYYKSYAIDGDRVFTVGWYGTLEFYNTSAPNTFEITLYEGSNNILFNYADVNVFSHTLTAGIQGTNGQYEQIINGNNANQLDNTAYLFTYVPPEPPPPEEPIAPDCSTNPAYINCIIQTVNSTPTETVLVDNNTEQTTETPDEPLQVVENTPQVIGGEAPSLEDLLAIADSATAEETVEEEKEKELADSITANILEQVLATTESSNTERSSRSNGSNEIEETTTLVAQTETIVEQNTVSENTQENTSEVVEQVSETNNVEEQQSVELLVNQTVVTETIETETNTTEEQNEVTQVSVAQQVVIEETVTTETSSEENTETQVVETSINQSIEIADQQTNETLVATIQSVETDNETVEQQVLDSVTKSNEKTFDEEDTDYGNSFISIAGTNTVLNTIDIFRDSNNMADKEASGALGKQEDKSDAEKKAEEIVAANAKEQEEINNNYMDADQSGLIGAIAGDTDVTAYRTSNIPDLSSWYKPEDIYKNVKYDDNKRGMYFLEKGNTDTYKKMVEEQYK